MRPRKRFAQHWLRSDRVLNQIVAAAGLNPDTDRVLEIGPGKGVLTRRLIEAANRVLAVEIDRDLCKHLVQTFGDLDNFLLLQGDFLSLDIEPNLKDFPQFQPNKVVANIPYNITGPVLEKLLGSITNPNPHPYSLIVLLIQKEVADRLVATPKSKAYNALSVKMQYLAECELICDVPASAFYPPPKVDSAVVRILPQITPQPVINPRYLDIILKLGFAKRRKMLRNNLKSEVEPSRLIELLEQLEISPQARAEELSLENWIKLSNHLAP